MRCFVTGRMALCRCVHICLECSHVVVAAAMHCEH